MFPAQKILTDVTNFSTRSKSMGLPKQESEKTIPNRMQQRQTLRGVFPERPVPPRRNFIRENVLRIKSLQRNNMHTTHTRSDQNAQAQVAANVQNTASLSKLRMNEKSSARVPTIKRRAGVQKAESRPAENRVQHISDPVVAKNASHRGIQTSPIKISDDCGEGAIFAANVTQKKGMRHRTSGYGDTLDVVDSPTASTSKVPSDDALPYLNQHVDYIRRNTDVQKTGRAVKKGRASTTSAQPANASKHPPAGSKKGTPPKGCKPKGFPDPAKEQPSNCPEGHALLPEDERKETLRVLRQSYAEKIQEMNSLPVRNDTMRLTRRKIELENELKKLEKGINIFQQATVFVKINA